MTDQPSEQVRPTIDVDSAVGGWPAPWPNVAELASVLPTDRWTLVGGLMTQLHTVHHGLAVVRPTNDVDIILHIETSRGVPDTAATALEAIGYELQDAVDPRNNTGHRFVRGTSTVDLVAGTAEDEIVDVLISDHPAPKVIERLRGREMVRIEGGTQALRRTINARLEIEPGTITTVSVPRPFGALIESCRVHHRLPRPRPSLVRRGSLAGLHRGPIRRARRPRRLRPHSSRHTGEGTAPAAPCLAATSRTRPCRRRNGSANPLRARLTRVIASRPTPAATRTSSRCVIPPHTVPVQQWFGQARPITGWPSGVGLRRWRHGSRHHRTAV